MPRRKLIKRIVNWKSYFKYKAAGTGIGIVGGGMLALAIAGILVSIIFIWEAIINRELEWQLFLIMSAIILPLSIVLSWYSARVLGAAIDIAYVEPVTDRNIHVLPNRETLVRGTVAPAPIQRKELLRSVEEKEAAEDQLLRAVKGASDARENG